MTTVDFCLMMPFWTGTAQFAASSMPFPQFLEHASLLAIDGAPLFQAGLDLWAGWFGMETSQVEIAFWMISVALVNNTACAILGCYLVLRRMSLLGDAISHSILAGIAVAFLLTSELTVLPMFLGALTVGMLTALFTQTLSSYARVPEDSSMGVVFTSLFALGVILIAFVDRVHLDVDCVLYGLLEFVSLDTVPVWGIEVPRALGTLLPTLLLTVLFVGLFWKELKLASFDPQLATAMGFSALGIYYGLMAVTATVTVAALEAVGAIIVIAMLIVPGATAHLLTDRLPVMILWAVLVGAVSAVGGYWWADHLSTRVSGMMAAVAGVQFLLAVLFAPKHGMLMKLWHNARLSLRIVAEDIIAGLYRLEEERTAAGAEAAVGASRAECLKWTRGGWLSRLAISYLRFRGKIRLLPGKQQILLTEAGRESGRSLVRSHRLWEAFLDEHFDLPADHLHEPASRIEHYIGPALQDKLASELDRPMRDPHGAAIPPADASRGSDRTGSSEPSDQ